MITKKWAYNIDVVKISSVEAEFGPWLYGQTLPLLEDDPDPYDWAYLDDYIRFKNNLPVID